MWHDILEFIGGSCSIDEAEAAWFRKVYDCCFANKHIMGNSTMYNVPQGASLGQSAHSLTSTLIEVCIQQSFSRFINMQPTRSRRWWRMLQGVVAEFIWFCLMSSLDISRIFIHDVRLSSFDRFLMSSTSPSSCLHLMSWKSK